MGDPLCVVSPCWVLELGFLGDSDLVHIVARFAFYIIGISVDWRTLWHNGVVCICDIRMIVQVLIRVESEYIPISCIVVGT